MNLILLHSGSGDKGSSMFELIREFKINASIINWIIDIGGLCLIGACCYSMRWVTRNMVEKSRTKIKARTLDLHNVLNSAAPQNKKPEKQIAATLE